MKLTGKGKKEKGKEGRGGQPRGGERKEGEQVIVEVGSEEGKGGRRGGRLSSRGCRK